ncbi:MAG TPA: T9SS type A sorting domain-containing protein [Bacteroidia bacterium]|jgi:hypothetical protein|nr:T9SS type A sorting domain-containing protein [Bacteroidia bacterium]
MTTKKILAFVFSFFCLAINAQEQLQALGGNAVLINYVAKNKKNTANTQKAQSITPVAAFLPFWDDFSYNGPYPDTTKWLSSNSVFVNHSKALRPITIGVATFDGIDSVGYPYKPNNTTGSYTSDTLWSIPLRLDSLNNLNIIPSDSVTLRFYYQAKGFWEYPDNGDDFMLDFYNPTTKAWSNVWSKGGYNPGSDSSFHRVMIAITDTAYLKNGFRFRFHNLSTACGDVDHWHLDAVFMDKKLNPKRDTIVQEVSFAYDLGSLLKNYSQMPYKQFTGAADMSTNINANYNLRNNYPNAVNLTTYYQISDNTGAIVAQNTNGTNNVLPFGSGGYCSNQVMVDPSLNGYVYNNGVPFTNSTYYTAKFYTAYISDSYHTNDTIYYTQKFDNYFAYDDGSAEAGYGFQGTTANGSITAVRYKLNVPDTLRAIDVFFDPVINVSLLLNSNIRLYVLADNGGIPGNAIFIDSLCWPYPVFSQNGFDIFQRYQLTKPVIFTSASTFYIAIEQTLGISLNIGYDLNTDHHNEILYMTPNNVNNPGWNVSSFKGSLMMHPVFGDSLRAVGVKSFTSANEKEKSVIYPNPATNEVFVSSKNIVIKIVLCDLLGNILLEENSAHANISAIPNGMYLVKTFTTKGFSDTQKLIIAR